MHGATCNIIVSDHLQYQGMDQAILTRVTNTGHDDASSTHVSHDRD
jgi:hypothetical protein